MNEEERQRRRRENEEKSTMSRARLLGLEYLDMREEENTTPLLKNILDVSDMRTNFVLPFHEGSGEDPFEFLVTSNTPRHVITTMAKKYNDEGKHIRFYLISTSAFNAIMLRYDPPVETHYDDIKISNEGDSDTFASVSRTLDSVTTEKVFDFLIEQADKLGASDIHIENLRDTIRIRMRVDGILHPVANISRDRYRVLMGELSSRANVSSASSKPQSGHIQKDIFSAGSSHTLNIRVETIPTMYGMDAVLRLFNFDESLLNLDLLGLTEGELREIKNIVSHPRGLVLMVGPTGSGKSTTLYSILNALNSTDRKIITLEDPIEYSITGISQIPVDTTKGDSFADGLRSVLRLDPDVVMIGEIRDADTARTAIQASITGHLVLSSFHANSSSAAFSRMIDLIGTNPIFSSSIRLVIAQRLVRKLGQNKEPYKPDESTLSYMKNVFAGYSGIDWEKARLFRPVPSEDNPFGYSGRMCLMEQLIVTDDIQAFIRGDIKDINTNAIERIAKSRGMLTLEQKGILACLRGDTTLEEISRVI